MPEDHDGHEGFDGRDGPDKRDGLGKRDEFDTHDTFDGRDGPDKRDGCDERGGYTGCGTREESLMLVDGNSIVNRAYFAFANQTRLSTSKGFPTHAIYGFLNIFNKYFEELRPTRVCIAFDMRAPTFRHREYSLYKAGRKGMPDDLAIQLPKLKEVIDALGFVRTECEGYEADDILGTLSQQAAQAGMKCVIITGDRDSLQLISQTTRVFLPVTRAGLTRTEEYDEAALFDRYGVTPELFIDLKGLMGDSSDNIPGVSGIGEKTAIELIGKFGGVDDIYACLGDVGRASVKAKLEAGKEMAYLSRRLATIVRDAPCDVSLEDLKVRAPDRGILYKLFTELRFQSYIMKMGLTALDAQGAAQASNGQVAATEASNGHAAAQYVQDAAQAADTNDAAQAADTNDAAQAADTNDAAQAADTNDAAQAADTKDIAPDGHYAVQAANTNVAAQAADTHFDSFTIISSAAAFDDMASAQSEPDAGGSGSCSCVFYPVFEKNGKFEQTLFAAALVTARGAYYFETEEAAVLRAGNAPNGNEPQCYAVPKKDVLAAIRRLFTERRVRVAGHDVKQLSHWLLANGESCPAYDFDTMLAAYVIDAASGEYNLQDIYYAYFDKLLDNIDELRGKGKSRKALCDIDRSRLAEVCVKCARAVGELAAAMKPMIAENGQEDLYYNIELPLTEVLASMEVAGFRVDVDGLRAFSSELDSFIEKLTAQIHELAGEAFNINSTRQLGVVLYEKLGLKPAKKTKTGYSTDADALLDLAGKHPIVEKITDYRQHVKLRSTYTDALIDLIDPADGRIHTTMNQAVTATGRISSAEPNLQNIPVRLALGREIRRLFVPEGEGSVLLGADYSQIELRVLAHLSEDAAFAQAFRDGDDIHRSTAARVFGVAEADVTDAMRTRAKAVNFGIVYGIGDFSLARDIGVTRKEAREYIDSYLDKYEGVKRYMKEAVEEGKRTGYAYTLLHRRRSLAELKSANFNTRAFGERVAMNTPVQGSAADIIKIAMVRAYKELQKRGLKSRLILQVHDELIIEACAGELDEAALVLRESMEQAVSLSVPLVADVYYGTNWKDIKASKI